MQIWEQFLIQQETELGTETVNKWLRSLRIQRFDACNLYLEVKDSFQMLWFEEHIRNKVEAVLFNGNNKKIKVHLSLTNTSPAPIKNRGKTRGEKKTDESSFQITFDELDPSCLFHHFVFSEENELTQKILLEIAGIKEPSKTTLGVFNPLFLYGDSGSGKTHLLMSLTHAFRAQGYKSTYVRAEHFTDHVVTAIRAGEMSTFRQTYRNTDILIVDDIHVFSRKGATQEEFFHTFNTLHLAGKQIILSANCPPQELLLIEPRLVSRFEWGMALPLKSLQGEKRKELLLSKSKALNFPLSSKVIDYLDETFKSNPKLLIKAFEALILRLHVDAQNSSQNLSVTGAKTLLSDLLAEEQKAAITFQKIIQAAADHFGIKTDDILGKSQKKECALPRQVAMHLCRDQLKLPFMKIGDLFSRDHSTVMTSYKFIQKSIEEGHRDISNAWHAILKKLQNQTQCLIA